MKKVLKSLDSLKGLGYIIDMSESNKKERVTKMNKTELITVVNHTVENCQLMTLGEFEDHIKCGYVSYDGHDFEHVVLETIRKRCNSNQPLENDRIKHYSRF